VSLETTEAKVATLESEIVILKAALVAKTGVVEALQAELVTKQAAYQTLCEEVRKKNAEILA